MYSYTIIQWLFIFYFYCFFGWCFESCYVSLKKKRWVNRGFMRGPFLPLYGSGAVMMLVVSMPFRDNLLLVYVAGCIGATILEYATGVTMEALFKVRYWDYSKNPFNFQGHICLGSSLAWGGLTIFMTEWLHKPVEKLVLMVPGGVLTVMTLLLTAYICGDFALSVKAAMDLRDILVKMEQVKEEIQRIHKRLDVIIAVANESISNRAESFEAKVDDWKNDIDGQLEGIRKLAAYNHSEYLESVREELAELKAKYNRTMEERDKLGTIRDFYQRHMIRSNPTMNSKYFKEALEELKKRAENRTEKNKTDKK